MAAARMQRGRRALTRRRLLAGCGREGARCGAGAARSTVTAAAHGARCGTRWRPPARRAAVQSLHDGRGRWRPTCARVRARGRAALRGRAGGRAGGCVEWMRCVDAWMHAVPRRGVECARDCPAEPTSTRKQTHPDDDATRPPSPAPRPVPRRPWQHVSRECAPRPAPLPMPSRSAHSPRRLLVVEPSKTRRPPCNALHWPTCASVTSPLRRPLFRRPSPRPKGCLCDAGASLMPPSSTGESQQLPRTWPTLCSHDLTLMRACALLYLVLRRSTVDSSRRACHRRIRPSSWPSSQPLHAVRGPAMHQSPTVAPSLAERCVRPVPRPSAARTKLMACFVSRLFGPVEPLPNATTARTSLGPSGSCTATRRGSHRCNSARWHPSFARSSSSLRRPRSGFACDHLQARGPCTHDSIHRW
jgi:hypothetical protein